MTGLLETLHGVKQSIRKRLGMGNDVQTHVRLTLPTGTDVSVGPFVRTEFEKSCFVCGEKGRYFHAYMDATARFNVRRLRCHNCYTDVYGEREEIPIPIHSPEDADEVAVYDAINPRELSWPGDGDGQLRDSHE